MKTLEIRYKYKVGDIVYFMYGNEIRRGIISDIQIIIESKTIKTYLTKKIVDNVVKIFDADYPMKDPIIRYSMDLISRGGDFQSSPHHRYEYDIYASKEDIIKEIS